MRQVQHELTLVGYYMVIAVAWIFAAFILGLLHVINLTAPRLIREFSTDPDDPPGDEESDPNGVAF